MMDSTVNTGMCRCCASEGAFKDIKSSYHWMGEEEIYSDMLKECFDIILNVSEPGDDGGICEVCITQLRNAINFKKQVLHTEEQFQKHLRNKTLFRPNIVKVEVHGEDDSDDNMGSGDEGFSGTEFEVPIKKEVDDPKPKKRAAKASATTTRASAKKAKADAGETSTKHSSGQQRLIQVFDYKIVGKLYQCTRCDENYSKLHKIKRHVNTHKRIEHKCSYCIDIFKTPDLLTIHELEVHNIDHRVTCSLCGRKYNTEKRLNLHMKKFHLLGENGRRYKCELCDFVTMKCEKLYNHKFNHKTERDQHCRFCSKSFKRRATLLLHERIHTGDRRSVCPECGQAFVQKASLNYHMTKYHAGVIY